jgi:hypothetical protein
VTFRNRGSGVLAITQILLIDNKRPEIINVIIGQVIEGLKMISPSE